MTASCLYEGSIRHRRSAPSTAFRHRIALAYIDLDELPGLLGGRLTRRAPGLVRFRRRDYLGDEAIPLTGAVRNTVERELGRRPSGPIRLLTQLRSWGHCFNPVSFYYCFDRTGETVEAVVAEVNSTPWGERHAYVLPGLDGVFDKQMHVSPFMGMEQSYVARASVPAGTLSFHIENVERGRKVFDATLAMRRRPLTRSTLRVMALRYPFATVRVLALIYAHAIGLKLSGAPYFPHPGRAAA